MDHGKMTDIGSKSYNFFVHCLVQTVIPRGPTTAPSKAVHSSTSEQTAFAESTMKETVKKPHLTWSTGLNCFTCVCSVSREIQYSWMTTQQIPVPGNLQDILGEEEGEGVDEVLVPD